MGLKLFIFDENYSPNLAKGLEHLENGNIKSPHRANITHINTLAKKQGTPDEEVIEIAGKNNGIIITKDADFKKIKHYYSLYKTHNAGVVYFKPQNGKSTYWDEVNTFIKEWERIKAFIANDKPPFAYQISKNSNCIKLEF
ncbi:MAG TPA: DUF5615 family PIN-like protein [Bacteroidia bacterium]|nr:DUF5615 family PIN-like protein [Bacteroidia bacterium]